MSRTPVTGMEAGVATADVNRGSLGNVYSVQVPGTASELAWSPHSVDIIVHLPAIGLEVLSA